MTISKKAYPFGIVMRKASQSNLNVGESNIRVKLRTTGIDACQIPISLPFVTLMPSKGASTLLIAPTHNFKMQLICQCINMYFWLLLQCSIPFKNGFRGPVTSGEFKFRSKAAVEMLFALISLFISAPDSELDQLFKSTFTILACQDCNFEVIITPSH